jgi:hypothetical protein
LPDACANVLIQDPVNPDLLYAGLDNGTYVSLDKGKTWHLFSEMLNVSAYDMIVHPRDHELVVATHGRSVFVADVKALQELKGSSLKKAVYAFSPEPVRYDEKWGEQEHAWSKKNRPQVELLYYVQKKSSQVNVKIYNEKDELIREYNIEQVNGFHRLYWDLKIKISNAGKSRVNEQSGNDAFVGKGKYKALFRSGSESSEVVIEVK